MRFSRLVLGTAIILSFAGCVKMSEPSFSTRGATARQIASSASANEMQMAQQTSALNQMTRNIVRKSTLNGAAIGALAGCGLVILSASNAKNCVSGILVGGAVGAIAGNTAGKRQAVKRVELVSPSALVRSIGKADDSMDVVSQNLTNLLKRQDAELEMLNRSMANGQITEAQFANRFEAIKANRANLAEALSLSAAQANEAHRNIQSAQAKGQTGLDWHLSATKELAREATSARSAISLL